MSTNFNRSLTVAEATQRLMQYCAYQDRCHKEVKQKMRDYGLIPQAQDQILGKLIEGNYLNEERFARSFARGKFNIKHWGKNRIVCELKFREISSYNIKAALTEISEPVYHEKLHWLAEKKLSTIKEKNLYKKKKKLADYLLYRGWESHLVYEKINELVE
ncbi:regulatory protein RecX [Gangjinia marincola]|uniref:Regulatory protein RecX n=1 Tax=Gangjinia marincola TaxID=578463 RepID=A0ABP3XTQ5_9FLAO